MSEHQAEHRHETSGMGCCGCGGGTPATVAPGITLVTDPVCGMKVDPTASKHRLDHGGSTFHFCSAGCQAKFAAAPDTYGKPKVATPKPAKPGAIYT